jgi:hypothetical protein
MSQPPRQCNRLRSAAQAACPMSLNHKWSIVVLVLGNEAAEVRDDKKGLFDWRPQWNWFSHFSKTQ